MVDHRLGVGDLAGLLTEAAGHGRAPPVPGDVERLILDEDSGPGVVSAFTCPHCGGALWERSHNGVVTFACRVGHRYSPASLFETQGDALDDALWTAHRALLERADLARRMGRRLGGRASSAPRSSMIEPLTTPNDGRRSSTRRS